MSPLLRIMGGFSGTILFVLSFLFCQSALAGNSCKSCWSSFESDCKQRCVGAGQRRAACEQGCMRLKCGKVCGGEKPEEDLGSSGEVKKRTKETNMSCDACLHYMFRNDCVARCKGLENRRRCQTTCAKLKCSNKCSLPARSVEEPKRKPQLNCGDCKHRARGSCSGDCGEKSRPGYLSCEVACVEKKCLKNCNPQLF